ncbi:hypothetical protein FGIG_12251 [Fasciola gigantica]|uniref:Uncharacterized protein n=1 Tax=Fasciola gigantica TaxID=46835 RepID=A0A504YKK3_FASGI|nr:hypothetical protein FGIG_12251 [Fasciola gigantica]
MPSLFNFYLRTVIQKLTALKCENEAIANLHRQLHLPEDLGIFGPLDNFCTSHNKGTKRFTLSKFDFSTRINLGSVAFKDVLPEGVYNNLVAFSVFM